MQDGVIHQDEFALALFKTKGQGNLFVDRVFQAFDLKKNQVVDFEEFIRSLSIFHPRAPLMAKAECELRAQLTRWQVASALHAHPVEPCLQSPSGSTTWTARAGSSQGRSSA